MKYHLTLVRMVIINKSTNNKCWQVCGEKGTLVHCWWYCRLVQPLWKTLRNFLRKLRKFLSFGMELPFDTARTLKQQFKRTMNPNVHSDRGLKSWKILV